jgi:uncharacterized protein YchJ
MCGNEPAGCACNTVLEYTACQNFTIINNTFSVTENVLSLRFCYSLYIHKEEVFMLLAAETISVPLFFVMLYI